MKARKVTLMTEDFLERMVSVLGESSTAFKALEELRRRRAAGEESLVIVCTEDSFLLVPQEVLIPA